MIENRLTGKNKITTAYHKFGSLDFMRSNAYCNLNEIAVMFGKRVDNWMRLKGTKELLQAFRDDPSYNGVEPMITSKGGLQGHTSHLRYALKDRGTFVHPDIAIQFAQWCSPAFALWVSRQIRHLMTYGEVNIHHTEWTPEQHLRGVQFGRDDISDMYGSRA